MRRVAVLAVAIVVILIGLSFAMLNAESVELDYYFGRAEMPLSLWLIIAIVVGAILGALSAVGIVLRQQRELARLRRRANVAEKELSELRKAPIRNVR